jgi:TRAP-type C4-dicarboxylate transport system permease small subunit
MDATAAKPPLITRPPFIERLTAAVAVAGGLLALGVGVLVTTSVLGRWLFSKPIEGDFEFVKMATAIAVFGYLPYTQARRGNIMVDTFTGWLPARARALLDAFWDFCFAGAMGFCAIGLARGTMDSIRSGETTMQLQIILWPVIGLCGLLCLLCAVTAAATAVALVKDRP